MAKVKNGLTAWQKQLRQAMKPAQRQAFYEECCKELAARFLRNVIKRTPVGEGSFEVVGTIKRGKNKGKPKLERLTKGGTLHRGWTSKTEQEAMKGRGRARNIIAHVATLEVKSNGKTYTITCKNPVSYSSYVETGHRQNVGQFVPVLGKQLKQSWVRGQFMMQIASDETAQQAEAVLSRKIKKKLEEMLLHGKQSP